MNRQEAERQIRALFGAPGADETDDGLTLLIDLLRGRGLAALTDAAVIELADLHSTLDIMRRARRRS